MLRRNEKRAMSWCSHQSHWCSPGKLYSKDAREIMINLFQTSSRHRLYHAAMKINARSHPPKLDLLLRRRRSWWALLFLSVFLAWQISFHYDQEHFRTNYTALSLSALHASMEKSKSTLADGRERPRWPVQVCLFLFSLFWHAGRCQWREDKRRIDR